MNGCKPRTHLHRRTYIRQVAEKIRVWLVLKRLDAFALQLITHFRMVSSTLAHQESRRNRGMGKAKMPNADFTATPITRLAIPPGSCWPCICGSVLDVATTSNRGRESMRLCGCGCGSLNYPLGAFREHFFWAISVRLIRARQALASWKRGFDRGAGRVEQCMMII